MTIASSLANGSAYFIGVISLTVWSLLALWDRVLRPSKPDQTFDKAQHDLWSLSLRAETRSKLQHHFLPLPDCRLHYLSPSPPAWQKRGRSSDLVVFLHGFPDSCHVFTRVLRSPLAEHADVVALDLPGFGGSEGLPAYGAEGVLNVVSAAIALLRRRYLKDDSGQRGRCVVVGHDWGSVVASRLAMETRGLIDRVVLVNGVVPGLFSLNVRSGINGCRKALRAWWRDRSNTAALGEAKEAIRPVLAQVVKSNYIFMFRLPFFRMRWFAFVVEYLLSVCHRAAAKNDEGDALSSWSWASSVGPGVAECTKLRDGLVYGQSVLDRALGHPRGDWDTRLRLYREDLFSGHWVLRGWDVGADGVEKVSQEEAKQFQCPASVLFGVRDFALDHRICVRGVEKLFRAANGKESEESQIVLIEDCGHWLPLDERGSAVLIELLLEILDVDGHRGGNLATRKAKIRRSDFK